MSGPRIAAHIEVSGLIRRAETCGGGAMILARGDREAGTMLLVLCERGDFKGILDRSLSPSGDYRWRLKSAADVDKKQSLNDFIAIRRRIDADLWVVELDIPEAERFAAELVAEG